MSEAEKPIKRSHLRLRLGRIYYGTLRRILWIRMKKRFASTYKQEKLPFSYFSHKSILLRKLKNVDMWLQYNKIINLKLAVKKLNGIIIRPGEVFSYWKLIGKPSKRKGYVKGMILENGAICTGTGGGLCQLSNLIFWMTLHTPLTVIERHRHTYDVFPDSNRTQPFGSGATCFYPYGDLMIQNNTQDTYQLLVSVGEEYLEGEWLVTSRPEYSYKVVEKNHIIKGEYWGGFSRNNELYQQKYDINGNMIDERLIVKNSAIMMYSPFLEDKG
ncbi:VanW family protein [Lachnospiraceae bacterium MD1]|jgi:vancomycin resistance protein VanW|uniref:VanW family protein n=1 Tax=Variimorphobacter saccharofermentans TaxID=2755051 RepID=A0A839K0P3_9FIRM|nr:VanW family protein [Variimorphobacter saccharofermentans]MBB2183485.1 VanW family protein [Variimorphobacter saccharofermentans]